MLREAGCVPLLFFGIEAAKVALQSASKGPAFAGSSRLMEYPVWYLTAPILIPAVALPRAILAQFAVGAGILLADLMRRAHKAPVLSEWGSFSLFLVTLLVALVLIGSIVRVAIHCTAPDPTNSSSR